MDLRAFKTPWNVHYASHEPERQFSDLLFANADLFDAFVKMPDRGGYAFPYSYKPAQAAVTHVSNENFNPDYFRAEQDTIRLIWSFMHEDETLLCPMPARKYEAFRLATLCKVRLGPETEVYKLARTLQKTANLSAKDAVHLACAVHGRADFFLTCDDRLLKPAKRLALEVEVLNPVDYIRKAGATWD